MMNLVPVYLSSETLQNAENMSINTDTKNHRICGNDSHLHSSAAVSMFKASEAGRLSTDLVWPADVVSTTRATPARLRRSVVTCSTAG